MSAQPPNPELQEALVELQQYLSDALPPLTVADSVQLLLKYPPDVVANAIRAWTGAQYRRGNSAPVPVSDYLYHTLKKIHMMAEFHLVPREPLEIYLAGLRPLILQLCPAEDRAMLLENLGRLGEAPAESISQAQNIFRQSSTEGAGARASASASGAAAAGGSGLAGSRRHAAPILARPREARGPGRLRAARVARRRARRSCCGRGRRRRRRRRSGRTGRRAPSGRERGPRLRGAQLPFARKSSRRTSRG